MHKPKCHHLSISIVVLLEGLYIYMKSHQIDCMYNKTFSILWCKSFCLENFTVVPFDPHSQPCVRNIFSTSFTSQWVEEHTFHGYRLRETVMGYLIWWFATFHASLTDSCLLLTSDTISRAFSCKQTASIFTAVWILIDKEEIKLEAHL